MKSKLAAGWPRTSAPCMWRPLLRRTVQRSMPSIRSIAHVARLPEMADDMIRRGLDLAAARRELLNRLATEDERTPTCSAHVPTGGFRRWRLAWPAASRPRDPLSRGAGVPVRGVAPRSGNPVMHRARCPPGARAAGTAGDQCAAPDAGTSHRACARRVGFPQLLSGTGNRILRAAYEAAPSGIRQIARQATAVDFRAKQTLMLGEAPELKKVNENGEFTRGTLAEAAEKLLAEHLRSDLRHLAPEVLVGNRRDLGAFADLTRRFARSAMEVEAKLLVTLVTSNPTMADGVAVFHANHGNLAASGGAISTTTLGPARSAMRLQKKGSTSPTPINATPR